jgi:NADPH:quinone reductase-like Zn-dependent oxidoreductase
MRVEQRPDPVAGPGQIVIDVAAAGVNFADAMATMGFYRDAPKPPCVLGYEVAGTVAGLGPGVDDFQVGQRVMAATHFGGYASAVAVDAGNAIALSDSLSFEQGAAIPVHYATAWTALLGYGSLRRGERVLIHAAAGGVGIAATQIARRFGAEIWGTASPGKHDQILGFGVEHPLDYTRAGWERGLPKFDLVMDAIGGRSFRTSYDLLAPGGRLVMFGASSVISGDRRNLVAALRMVTRLPRFNVLKQMSDSKAVIGLNLLTLWDARGTLEPWLAPLHELLDDGTIQPVVAGMFDFDHAADAHRMLIKRRNVGKVVLVS